MSKITEHQKKVLAQIWSFIRSEGKAPSYRELMKNLNIKSTQTLADFLARLEKKGFIIKEFAKRRSINLTPKAVSLLADIGTFSLGIAFYSKYNYFSDDISSTNSLNNPKPDFIHIKTDTDEETESNPRQLSLFDTSNSAIKNKDNTNLSHRKTEYLSQLHNFLENYEKLFNSSGKNNNLVTIQNLNLIFFLDQKKELNLFSRLNLNLKAEIDKLLDFFKHP